MEIRILQLVEGARQAKGLTIVIDVFRAFSTACYVFGNGAREILCTGEVETAFRLKKENPERILMGERGERKVEGFDFGNSPSQLEGINLDGKTFVQTTSAGTQGMVNARAADEILAGSFVNADAIAAYIRSASPDTVSLVCMGYAARYPVEEDTLCAEYIKQKILGQEPDYDAMANEIRRTSGTRFFLAANQDFAPSTDFYMCLDLNRFDFVLRATPIEEGVLSLKKADYES